MSLISEIREQPAVLRTQLKEQKENVLEIAAKIKKLDPAFVHFIARGTSDHAGIYAQYLLGIENHLSFSLACPSMATCYGEYPNVKNALTVAVSQSGKSPDLIASVDACRKQGSPVLVITNTLDSPLGRDADFTIDCMAGPERATAATKSYTTSLMAFAMLSAALNADEKKWAEIDHIPEWTEKVFELEEKLKAYAERYVYATHCIVLSRGMNLATSKEWGLKLQELTYMMAEPYSSADFQHGPIAMVDKNYPVLAVACEGKVLDSMLPQMENIRKNLHGDIFAITNSDKVAALASRCVRIPAEVPEWLSPIVAIIPAQLFAYHLCAARGFNTETPRTISKVTETK